MCGARGGGIEGGKKENSEWGGRKERRLVGVPGFIVGQGGVGVAQASTGAIG